MRFGLMGPRVSTGGHDTCLGCMPQHRDNTISSNAMIDQQSDQIGLTTYAEPLPHAPARALGASRLGACIFAGQCLCRTAQPEHWGGGRNRIRALLGCCCDLRVDVTPLDRRGRSPPLIVGRPDGRMRERRSQSLILMRTRAKGTEWVRETGPSIREREHVHAARARVRASLSVQRERVAPASACPGAKGAPTASALLSGRRAQGGKQKPFPTR